MAPIDPKIKIFSSGGSERYSTISIKYNDVCVTIKEKGHKDISRWLRLDYGLKNGENKDRMGSWYCSLVNANDRDPTGRDNSIRDTTKQSMDPGRLPYLYQNHLNCLEVLTGVDTSGKWMIRPIAVEKRQAIYNAIQTATANTKQAQLDQALSFLNLAEEEARL